MEVWMTEGARVNFVMREALFEIYTWILWMTEGARVNFVMREALFEIYTWILCLSYLQEKQTSRIQSLYLYFIKIVPFWPRNIRF